ncbi:MAG TPA: alpha/beta fold hydrolase [Clostridia bacterium]|nr:alpha/beta fold hydrolase [Clostridia bacterium]
MSVKRIVCLLVCLVLALPVLAAAEESGWTPAAASEKAFNHLLNKEYGAVYEMITPSVQALVTAEAIGQAWQSALDSLGSFERVAQVAEAEQSGLQIVQYLVAQTGGQTVVTFGYGSDRLLAALTIQPVTQFVTETPLPVPEGAAEEAVALRAGQADETRGALTLPAGEGPYPAVILVQGSGASDMDESIMGIKPFRDLAMGLAAKGIASLRYDKYTYAHPDLFAGDPTVDKEYLADIRSAVQLLAADGRIGRIYIAGHSLGGILVPRLLQASEGLADGGIILAGSSRPLWEIQWMQNEDALATLQGEQLKQGRAIVDAELEKARRLLDMSPEELAAETVFGLSAAYQADLARDNPADIAKELGLPLLILQGEKDWQVKAEEDFAAWQKALEGTAFAAFKLYPGLSHVFIALPGESAGNVSDYANGGHVDQAVIDDIAAWIFAQN